ncbi:unnamed protein product, partial [Rotaria magnacalcarata]
MDQSDEFPSVHCHNPIGVANRKSASVDGGLLNKFARRTRKLFKTNDTFTHQLHP